MKYTARKKPLITGSGANPEGPVQQSHASGFNVKGPGFDVLLERVMQNRKKYLDRMEQHGPVKVLMKDGKKVD